MRHEFPRAQEGGTEQVNARGHPLASSLFPDDAIVVIYKPARSAMTSGTAGTREWKLRFERRSAPFVEPWMGWTGDGNTLAQIELSQTMRSDRPRFSSNSRVKGTPGENEAAVHGSMASFGTYTVNEAEKTITFRYLGSTFPNRERTEETRPVVINGNELEITHYSTSVGGERSHLKYRLLQ
jgi:hypothetical protein